MNNRRKSGETAVALMLLAMAGEQQSPFMFANPNKKVRTKQKTHFVAPKKNRRNKVKRAHKR